MAVQRIVSRMRLIPGAGSLSSVLWTWRGRGRLPLLTGRRRWRRPRRARNRDLGPRLLRRASRVRARANLRRALGRPIEPGAVDRGFVLLVEGGGERRRNRDDLRL